MEGNRWAAQKVAHIRVQGMVVDMVGVGKVVGGVVVVVDTVGKVVEIAMMRSEIPGAGGRSRAKRWLERWSEAATCCFVS